MDRERAREAMTAPERIGYLQWLRFGFCLLAVASALFAPETVGASAADIGPVTLAYALLVALFGVALRFQKVGATSGLVMLLVDGIYLAWVTYASGATQSPLRFLLYMHLIAVTLLVSHRTGMKIAVWHSLLIFTVFHAQLAGIIPARGINVEAVREGGIEIYQPSTFNALALWLVALGTAPFSSLNERELRRRKGDLEILADTAKEFENLSDAPSTAAVLLDRICSGFEFQRGVVLAGPDRDLKVVASEGLEGQVPDELHVDAIVEKAWAARETLLVDRLDPDANPTLVELLPDARNLLVAPLIADGQPIGVVVVEQARSKGDVIERRVVSMVGQFASHGALAIRNAWLLEQVQRLAATDALTGVANRRTFERSLQAEISRASRTRSDLTLVMLDIDRFKSLNDSFGHQTGDEVLARVGEALRQAARESDTPARYGGEEFVVLLPGCSAEESFAAAERLRKAVAGVKAAVPITVSAGIATFPIHGTTPDQLVAAADGALYESKRAGRDRSTRASASVTDDFDTIPEETSRG